ncbi:MAG: formate dehydrogenase accessory protein FdhE [Deltaproteobacteria bacterium]|nr:formate dehydrogenase accessory protein FdhE [Deltaproteobacteria bacterium]
MTEKEIVTTDQIRKAVAAVKAQRPAYEGLLDFYEKLCLAQEASKENTRLEPIKIHEDLLSVKEEEGFPLISTTDFVTDVVAAEALLRKLCELAVEANEVLAEAGPKIVDALDKESLDASTLFSNMLKEDDAYLGDVAGKLGIDKTILAFAVYNSIRPSISLCAEQLSTYLDKDTEWGKGYCPICGSPPGLCILRGEGGKRSLVCSFCGHEWRILRICCPFCDNNDQKTLHYFFSEEEKDYRVDVCDKCKKYIKTVDVRKIERPLHPLVEQISTLHLDMLAQEQGLESGIPLWLQM